MFGQPRHGENPICQECSITTPVRHANCTEPCSHIVSWFAQLARESVIRDALAAAERIRNRSDDMG